MHDLTVMNGEVEFAYLNTITPWHGLGTAMDNDVEWTLEEFEAEAGVDWTVRKEAVGTMDSGIVVPDTFALVREDTETILGTTGKRYEVFSHHNGLEEIAKYGKMSTMGSLGGGATVFGLVELDAITVGPESISRYLLAAMGNDGKTGVEIKNTDVCVVCHNTLDMALGGSGRKWSAKHTENIGKRFESISSELEALFDGSSAKALSDEIDKLLNTTISDNTVQETLEQVFPSNGKAISTEAWAVRGLYEQHPTIRNRNGEDIKGTQWGLYQAVSFYDLWSKDVRGDRLEKQAYATLDDNPTPNARKVAALMTKW